MTDINTQFILLGVSAGTCFVGTLLFAVSFILKKEKYQNYGIWTGYVAAVPVTLAMFFRWMETGHFPYIGGYEMTGSTSWFLLLFFLAIQLWKPTLRGAGLFVLPVTMLMFGLAMTGSAEITETPKSYFTIWLWVHILAAKVAYGSVIISGTMALAYLVKIKQEAKGEVSQFMGRFPSLERIDYFNYRFSALAFVMQGVMIGAGAIWAYKAWGRYWGWDPVETWALISWLVYGFYLHLRITGIRGRAASWVGVVAICLVIFALFGVPSLFPTVHETLRFVK